jgi:hypothetical protein
VLVIEVQPIGIIAPLYLICYELSRIIQKCQLDVEFDRIVKLVLGAVLGFAIYFILHPHILTLLARSSPADWNAYRGHFLYRYFFGTQLYRHLPELAAFIVHVWRQDYMRWSFPIIASFGTFWWISAESQ